MSAISGQRFLPIYSNLPCCSTITDCFAGLYLVFHILTPSAPFSAFEMPFCFPVVSSICNMTCPYLFLILLQYPTLIRYLIHIFCCVACCVAFICNVSLSTPLCVCLSLVSQVLLNSKFLIYDLKLKNCVIIGFLHKEI